MPTIESNPLPADKRPESIEARLQHVCTRVDEPLKVPLVGWTLLAFVVLDKAIGLVKSGRRPV